MCFSDFHAPPCADFCSFLSAIDFGAPLARLARLPSFSNFKLVCPLCSPCLHCARTTPAPCPRPAPIAPEIDRLKSLYSTHHPTTPLLFYFILFYSMRKNVSFSFLNFEKHWLCQKEPICLAILVAHVRPTHSISISKRRPTKLSTVLAVTDLLKSLFYCYPTHS